jgi:SMC interacting uncharacterized protein involved in chromosome segregation
MKRTIAELERYMEIANTLGERSNEIQDQIENLRREVLEREEQIQKLQQEN